MSSDRPIFPAELEASLRELRQGHESWGLALGLATDDIASLADYGRELLQHGQLEIARTIFDGLLVIEPYNASIRCCLGVLHQRAQRPGEALEELTEAARLDPDDAVAATHLGELQLEQGDLEAATLTLARARELGHGQSVLRHRAGLLLEIAHLSARELRVHGPEAVEKIRQRRHLLEQQHRRLPLLALPQPRVGSLRDRRLSELLSST